MCADDDRLRVVIGPPNDDFEVPQLLSVTGKGLLVDAVSIIFEDTGDVPLRRPQPGAAKDISFADFAREGPHVADKVVPNLDLASGQGLERPAVRSPGQPHGSEGNAIGPRPKACDQRIRR